MSEVPSMMTSSPISSCFAFRIPDVVVVVANRLAAVGVGKAGTFVGVIEPRRGVEGVPNDCLIDSIDLLPVRGGCIDLIASLGGVPGAVT